MAEPNNGAKGKIQATKQWLSRAEEHFDRDASMRGQLDLLLAEAELRSTREFVENGTGKLKQTVLQQSIAFGLAATLVVAGMGGTWWWWRSQAPHQTNSASRVNPPTLVMPAIMAPVSDKSAMVDKRSEPAPVTVVEAKSSVQEVKKEQMSVGEKQEVTPEEMKRLIQAAGQTLRGRTKQ